MRSTPAQSLRRSKLQEEGGERGDERQRQEHDGARVEQRLVTTPLDVLDGLGVPNRRDGVGRRQDIEWSRNKTLLNAGAVVLLALALVAALAPFFL